MQVAANRTMPTQSSRMRTDIRNLASTRCEQSTRDNIQDMLSANNPRERRRVAFDWILADVTGKQGPYEPVSGLKCREILLTRIRGSTNHSRALRLLARALRADAMNNQPSNACCHRQHHQILSHLGGERPCCNDEGSNH